ncbi:MAG: hypothetical protein U0841_16900 [Chloroflexia bacterium]
MTIEQVEALAISCSATSGTRLTPPFAQAKATHRQLPACAPLLRPQPNLDRAIVTFQDGHVIRVYYDND